MHLYVHVPFCTRRCSYCDFAIAVRRAVPDQAYAAAVEREWARWQSDPAWNASPGLETVYFGGGTPSRLDPDVVARLLDRFRADRPLVAGAEVTLEANPEDVDPARAGRWLESGVNRVSLGAQSFDPDVLRWMHRVHESVRIDHAVRVLRSAGFEDVSLDLIYGLPAALRRDWSGDLERAVALEPTHLSLYGLTVEPHTALGHWTDRGEVVPVTDAAAASEYVTAHRRLGEAGFEHYEVSNFARPGFHARHNSAYWRRAAYVGLGPSAHSGLGTLRRWNVREWEEYRRRSEAEQPVEEGRETLEAGQVRLEALYLGLRTTEGVPADWIPELAREEWIAAGWAEPRGKHVVLTAEGWLRLDALVGAVRDS